MYIQCPVLKKDKLQRKLSMTITSLALTCSNASSTKSERVKPIPPLWVCPRLCRHRPCYARWQLSRSRKWQSSVRSAESPQVVGTIYSIYIYIYLVESSQLLAYRAGQLHIECNRIISPGSKTYLYMHVYIQ